MAARDLVLAAGGAAGSGGALVADGIDFDGTNDYLQRTSDLTGNADGQTFTFSCWFWLGPSYGGQRLFKNWTGSQNRVAFTPPFSTNAGQFNLGTTVYVSIPTGRTDAGTWHHIVISGNMATGAVWCYINDQSAGASLVGYSSAFNIPFSQPTWQVAYDNGGYAQCRMAHVYLDKTFRDLSNATNRRLFITADRKVAAGQAALNPILYLPLNDPTQPGLNSGTGGNFTLTGTIARSGRGPNQFNPPYSDLDGTTQFLSRTSITGIADAKQFTLSWCGSHDDWNASVLNFRKASPNQSTLHIYYSGANAITIQGMNSAGTAVLSVSISNVVLSRFRNNCIQISVDLTSTSKRHVYVNGVDMSGSATWSVYTNDFIYLGALGLIYVGSDNGSAPHANARLGNVWFNTSYIDLSSASNRAKFVTGTGIDAKAADLGANGEGPTGTSPLIYLPMYGNNAGKNYGTGGDFTVNSGPYPGARGPNEFWGNKATFNGSSTKLSRGSIGYTNTTQFTLCAVVNPTAANGKIFRIGSSGTVYGMLQMGNPGTSTPSYLTVTNLAGTVVLEATFTISLSTTSFVQISCDISNTSKRHVFINGSNASPTWNYYDTATTVLAFTGNTAEIGAYSTVDYFTGWMSELYFTDTYIDFSQEANRLKFRDAFGNPVSLGADGSTPTGSKPLVYMRFDPAAFGTNYGTGGNYSVTGPITDGGQL